MTCGWLCAIHSCVILPPWTLWFLIGIISTLGSNNTFCGSETSGVHSSLQDVNVVICLCSQGSASVYSPTMTVGWLHVWTRPETHCTINKNVSALCLLSYAISFLLVYSQGPNFILFYFGHQDKIQTFNMWFVYLPLCVFVLLENLRSSRTTVTAHEIAFKVQHGALNHNEPCAKHF